MRNIKLHAMRVILSPILLIVLTGIAATWLLVFVFDHSYDHAAMRSVANENLAWAARFQHSRWLDNA